MTCGLPHLKRRADFVRIARKGRSSALPGLVLQVLRRSAEGEMIEMPPSIRLGITASRKVGGAVARNRARRRLRACARAVLPDRAAPGFDLVMIARPATLERPFAQLVADLETGLRRLGALRDAPPPPRRRAGPER